MSNLLLLLAIASNNGCPTPKMLDWTTLPWTQQDSKIYAGAIERCRAHFGKDAPCLKKFIKKGVHTYYAICGRTTNQTSSSVLGEHYWFTISDTEDTGQQDSLSAGSSAQNNRCGTACPLGHRNTGGGK